jgi:hypothetical protein
MYLLNNYIKHNYPEKHNELLIALSFNTIYMVSVVQIKFKKIIKYINQTNPRLLEFFNKYKNMKDVEFILNGKVFYLTTRENIVNHIVHMVKEDFIIYSDFLCIGIFKLIAYFMLSCAIPVS